MIRDLVGRARQEEEEQPDEQADYEQRGEGKNLLGRLGRSADVEAQPLQHPQRRIQPEGHHAAREHADEPLEHGVGNHRDPDQGAESEDAQKRSGE